MTAMRWNGWGDPVRAASLPEPVRQLLEQMLGVHAGAPAAVAADQVRLPERQLPARCLAQLAAIVGTEHVLTTAAPRLAHTRGKSTVDLLRMRGGDGEDAPDAVALPGTHDEVLAVLDVCARARVAVVPFGGGTSVVGGLAPARAGFAGVLALDLARLTGLTTVDPVSRTARLLAGTTGPEAERLLAGHGFTLGHFPQSFEFATIGGFAATRSSGQYSLGYGRFDEMVVALRVATPLGTVELGRAPRSAAGPDLRQLFLGSEGTLGVITDVTVRVRPRPVASTREAWRFASFDDGLTALRTIVQSGHRPTMLRLSDETETMVNAAMAGRPGAGCELIVAYEDAAAARDRPAIRAALADLGGTGSDGTDHGDGAAEEWERTRYQAPYLRDALLDAGALVETLETATFWSGLAALREAVRAALTAELAAQGTPPIVLCHVSHVYDTGAALYVTVVCAQAPDAVAQWTRAKQAATRAILDAGGTVTHHHAVGRDHAAGLAEEVGPLGLASLRAVKGALDPAGILNPGVLTG